MDNTLCTTRVRVGRSRTARLLIVATAAMVSVFATMRVGGSAAAAEQPAAMGASKGGDIVADGISSDGQLHLSVNKTAVISTKVPYKRVSVGQPEIADVNPIGPGNILVTAKKVGTTQLIIWDDSDRSQVIDVTVDFDLQALTDEMKTMFPDSKIEITSLNGAIALRGHVPTLQASDQALAIASPYSQKVLNFLEISGGQQVLLEVKFAEVSRTAVSQLGVNLGYSDGRSFGGSNIGQVSPFSILSTGTNSSDLNIGSPTAAVTLFGRGLAGDTAIAYFVDALRQNDLLRTLAEPNLVATSGQEASFLAGGEFPVPVTQGGGSGGVAVTVEYKEFGVKLKFVPVVLGDGHIRLKVAPEVSDLDFTTAVTLNGFVIPGLNSRKLETTVELGEGQTFALAGLLNNAITSDKQVTPVLGDIPVLGALFRSVRYQRKETELVVLVTPHLVSGMNPGQVPVAPGEHWREPTETDLFLAKDIGGEQDEPVGTTIKPADRAPAAFHGQYGFVPAAAPATMDSPSATPTPVTQPTTAQ
jgi:pilus assembly protein CpaC